MTNKTLHSNPWKDIMSYESSDYFFFKGRDEDIKKFLRILDNGTFSVIYSSSGIGKTSFLQAGVEPIMKEKGYVPIHILFHWQEDVEAEIIKTIEEKLNDIGFTWQPSFSKWDSLNSKERDKYHTTCEQSLWWRLRTYDLINQDKSDKHEYRLFLVMDQFEEVLRNENELCSGQLEKLFQLLQNIYSYTLPKDIQKAVDFIYEQGYFINLPQQHPFKLIFALRKEYLSEFDYWTNDRHRISDLLSNRMLLLPLTRQQAEEIIIKQPLLDAEGNILVGRYTETLVDVKNKIIDFIDNQNRNEIEPFLLSVLCSRLFEISIQLNKDKLTEDDLKGFNIKNIIRNFYAELIKKCLEDSIFETRKDVYLFENILVSELDGHRHRISIKDSPELNTLNEKNNKENKLDKLEKIHLIRCSSFDKVIYVEIVHDRIAEVIHARQEERKNLARTKKENRALWGIRVLWIIILGLLSLFSINYGFHHYEHSPYTELNKGKQHSEHSGRSFHLWDNLVEQLVINGQDSINLSCCYMLRNIEFENFNKDTLHLSITDCPLLETIQIPLTVKYLNVIRCHGCPKLKLDIAENIKEVIVGYNDNSFEFKTQKSKRYIWRDQILWDIKEKECVYTQLNDKKEYEVVIPSEIKKAQVEFEGSIFKQKNTAHQKEYTYRDTFFVNKKTFGCRDSIPRNITNIYFSDSVEFIYHDFEGCTKIRNLVIPASVKKIGSHCFANCTNLKFLKIEGNTDIGIEAFANCKSLSSIVFKGDSVRLNINAFANCTNLESINFPKYIEFNNPTDLESVPYSLNPFFGCFKIKEVDLFDNTNLVLKDGILFDKEKGIPLLLITEKFIFNKYKNYFSNDEGVFITVDENHTGIPILIKNPSSKSSYSSANVLITDSLFFDKVTFKASLLKPVRTLEMPTTRSSLLFLPGNFENLETIIMPFPQPRNILIYLPDSIKERVTLVVPDGCLKYYECHPEFSSFKTIKEGVNYNSLYPYFVKDTICSNYVITQFMSFYYLWIPLILAFALIIFYILIYAKQTRTYSFFAAAGYTILMLITYFPTYWLLFFFTDSTFQSNIISILISFFLGSILVFGRNLSTILISIPQATSIIAKDTMYTISKFISNHRLVLFMMLITSIFCVIGVYKYQNNHNLEKAIDEKNWNKAINIMCNNILSNDTLVANDSVQLRELLIHSIEIPNLSDDDCIFKKERMGDVSSYANGLFVVAKNPDEETRIYDFKNMKYTLLDIHSQTPFAKYCKSMYSKLHVIKDNLFFDMLDTTYIYQGLDITQTPKTINGKIYNVFDSLVCIRKDTIYTIFDIKDWTSKAVFNAKEFRVWDFYDKYSNTFVVSSKKQMNDTPCTINIVRLHSFEIKTIELPGSAKYIINGRYLVVENNNFVRYYDIENQRFLNHEIHGIIKRGNQDVIMTKDGEERFIFYKLDDNGQDIQTYNISARWTPSVESNYALWEYSDSLYLLNTKRFNIYNLGIIGKYRHYGEINDSLLYRFVDSIRSNCIYHIDDSIKLIQTIPSDNRVFINLPYIAFRKDTLVTIFDTSNSMRVINQFSTRLHLWGLQDGYCTLFQDFRSFCFKIGQIPDEAVAVEGYESDRSYPNSDGWCFQQNGNYVRLINIASLRLLIEKTNLLSNKKKQKLIFYLDKKKVKRTQ